MKQSLRRDKELQTAFVIFCVAKFTQCGTFFDFESSKTLTWRPRTGLHLESPDSHDDWFRKNTPVCTKQISKTFQSPPDIGSSLLGSLPERSCVTQNRTLFPLALSCSVASFFEGAAMRWVLRHRWRGTPREPYPVWAGPEPPFAAQNSSTGNWKSEEITVPTNFLPFWDASVC